ncbi:MAG: hypothetical protein KAV87_05430 [Desulfobacteraceae bacterium]|nr:hypothetical protein [Desulfobacteraceae bacterium]
MDPNLFHLDWERVGEVLVAIVILAFLLERALAVLFESRFFIKRWKEKSLKELIAFVVAVLACWYWDFDAVSMIFLKEKVTILGMIVTGGIVAGGSKGSIKLFRGVMGFKSTAQSLKEAENEAQRSQQASGQSGKEGGSEK